MPAIRAWLENAGRFGTPSESSTEKLLGCAAGLVERLRTPDERDVADALANDPETPDLLHAVVELLDRGRHVSSPENLADIRRTYELVTTVRFTDEFGEKPEMLARLAFLAWNQSRLAEDFPATQFWQSRCSEHTLLQEHVRDFFAVSVHDRSAELSQRYFADECVLLTACERLERHRNKAHAKIELEGAALYEWIGSTGAEAGLDDDLGHYLAAMVALATLGAKLGMQHMEDLSLWFARVESHLSACCGGAPLAATLEHRLLSRLYFENEYSVALNRIDALISKCEELKMVESATLVRFLKAMLLKDAGQLEKAFGVFGEVHNLARDPERRWLASLAISNLAQIRGSQGRLAEARRLAREAFEVASESGSVCSLAVVQGTAGELLRDHGDLEASIKAYAASVGSYEAAGMAGLAAYTRVLLAEALLMAGHPRDAATEAIAALPTIESHWLSQEAVAAIAILREAIRRQQSDSDALRRLREQLQQMHQEGKL